MIAEVVGHAAADSCHDDTTQVGQYGLDGEVGTFAPLTHALHR